MAWSEKFPETVLEAPLSRDAESSYKSNERITNTDYKKQCICCEGHPKNLYKIISNKFKNPVYICPTDICYVNELQQLQKVESKIKFCCYCGNSSGKFYYFLDTNPFKHRKSETFCEECAEYYYKIWSY